MAATGFKKISLPAPLLSSLSDGHAPPTTQPSGVFVKIDEQELPLIWTQLPGGQVMLTLPPNLDKQQRDLGQHCRRFLGQALTPSIPFTPAELAAVGALTTEEPNENQVLNEGQVPDPADTLNEVQALNGTEEADSSSDTEEQDPSATPPAAALSLAPPPPDTTPAATKKRPLLQRVLHPRAQTPTLAGLVQLIRDAAQAQEFRDAASHTKVYGQEHKRLKADIRLLTRQTLAWNHQHPAQQRAVPPQRSGTAKNLRWEAVRAYLKREMTALEPTHRPGQ